MKQISVGEKMGCKNERYKGYEERAEKREEKKETIKRGWVKRTEARERPKFTRYNFQMKVKEKIRLNERKPIKKREKNEKEFKVK